MVLVIFATFGWFFFFTTNVPNPTPPRWTVQDKIKYRWYVFSDKLGTLTPVQKVVFTQYIVEGLEFVNDSSKYQECVAVSCASAHRKALEGKMDAWHMRLPPAR